MGRFNVDAGSTTLQRVEIQHVKTKTTRVAFVIHTRELRTTVLSLKSSELGRSTIMKHHHALHQP